MPFDLSEESLRSAMELAWRDHHHARDQTWKALQIEAVIGAGLVTVDAQFGTIWATVLAGLLTAVAAVFGILISLNHRKVERRKFIHIVNCEEELGLHRHNVIPLASRSQNYEEFLKGKIQDPQKLKEALCTIGDGQVGLPQEFSFWRVFDPRCRNTAVFILRMHIAVILFALLIVVFRYWKGNALVPPMP